MIDEEVCKLCGALLYYDDDIDADAGKYAGGSMFKYCSAEGTEYEGDEEGWYALGHTFVRYG